MKTNIKSMFYSMNLNFSTISKIGREMLPPNSEPTILNCSPFYNLFNIGVLIYKGVS